MGKELRAGRSTSGHPPGRVICPLTYDSIFSLKQYGYDGSAEFIETLPGHIYGKALKISESRQGNIRHRIYFDCCPHCGDQLKKVIDDGPVPPIRQHLGVDSCEGCGFWKVRRSTSITGTDWLIPHVRSFHPQRHVAALTSLLGEVKANKARLYRMTPGQFELFVGTVLMDFFNCEVRHLGRPHDGGVDLLVVAADTPVLVQVKRRSDKEAVEGVEVVRHLFASMFAAGSQKGMVVTTAQRFSRNAQEWIHLPNLQDQSFEIELVDVRRLLDMVKACRTGSKDGAEPWRLALDSLFDVAVELLARAAEGYDDDDSSTEAEPEAGNWRAEVRGESLQITLQSQPQQSFLFDGDKRDRCWLVAGRAQSEEGQDPPANELVGEAFTEVLLRLPDAALDKLVELWAGSDRNLVVELGRP